MGNVIALLAGMLFIALVFSMIGLVMYQLAKRSMKWLKVVTVGAVLISAYFFMTFSSLKKSTDMTLQGIVLNSLEQNRTEFLKQAKKNELSQEKIDEMNRNFDYSKKSLVPAVVAVFPALAVIGAIFISFIIYMIIRFFIIKRNDFYDSMPPFDMWYLNDTVMWIFLVSLALVAAKNILGGGLLFRAGINVLVVLLNMYFLIGLAIVINFLNKKKAPRFMQFLILFLIMIWPMLSIAVLMTGVLDNWINFRKITKGGKIWK